MRTRIFQVDAFTTRRFAGNPAAVLPLPEYPSDEVLLAIAAENNLAETAFLVKHGGDYRLRWFTPVLEVPLCGHATLASAAVVMEKLEPGRRRVVFHTKSGPLTVDKTAAGYVLDFPARPSEATAAPQGLAGALGAKLKEVTVNPFNYLARVESLEVLRGLTPDMAAVERIDRPGIIVTAPGDGAYDFYSRYFAPGKGIPEDPVTGAAHCMLTPYWSQKLGKSDFRAFQASPRGGEVQCRLRGERVELEGSAVFFMEGEAEI
ncbi:MAG TPA: PhzF family phenazine biosynthesis protein [Gammaproteobacteria bacterium]|jgi:PhzF family phenazine biosynthesis protein